MEIQLQELIDQIKKEGVDTAKTQASEILADAHAKADKIIEEAQAKADRILQNAEEENQRFVKVSEEAISQAGRNMLISFRESVAKELDALVGAEIQKALSSNTLSALLVKVAESWAQKPETEDFTLLLNTEDLSEIETELKAKLKEKMLSGITLKAGDNFNGGFRIVEKDGKAYYDYSTEALTQMMSTYLNPRVTAIMKEAEKA